MSLIPPYQPCFTALSGLPRPNVVVCFACVPCLGFRESSVTVSIPPPHLKTGLRWQRDMRWEHKLLFLVPRRLFLKSLCASHIVKVPQLQENRKLWWCAALLWIWSLCWQKQEIFVVVVICPINRTLKMNSCGQCTIEIKNYSRNCSIYVFPNLKCKLE